MDLAKSSLDAKKSNNGQINNGLTFQDPFLRNELWSSFLLHLQPLDEFQCLAILDLADAMKWNSVALISSMDSYGE